MGSMGWQITMTGDRIQVPSLSAESSSEFKSSPWTRVGEVECPGSSMIHQRSIQAAARWRGPKPSPIKSWRTP